jgi:hypothetical protein
LDISKEKNMSLLEAIKKVEIVILGSSNINDKPKDHWRKYRKGHWRKYRKGHWEKYRINN